MFALVILLLVAQDHNVSEPVTVKYVVQSYKTETLCEEKRAEILTSIPKEWKVTAVRAACVRLGPELSGS